MVSINTLVISTDSNSLFFFFLKVNPSFPHLIGLGGELIVRSSWSVYLQEFAIALHTMMNELQQNTYSDETLESFLNSTKQQFNTNNPLTHFEKKYFNIGVPVYQLQIYLEERNKHEREIFINRMKQ
jgi:tRNA G46 methylase TrmB